MTTMNISLTDDLKQFVEAQVNTHGFTSTSEYLRDLIRKQRDIEKLRSMLLEGFNSGPATLMEPDFFEKMRKRARARAAVK